jgi:hypothetical protein
MPKEDIKPIEHFLCAICKKKVVVDELGDIEDFRIGVNLFCLRCGEQITVGVMNKFLEDTDIPKTYRTMLESCLPWRRKTLEEK